jgi:hypothetical protein
VGIGDATTEEAEVMTEEAEVMMEEAQGKVGFDCVTDEGRVDKDGLDARGVWDGNCWKKSKACLVGTDFKGDGLVDDGGSTFIGAGSRKGLKISIACFRLPLRVLRVAVEGNLIVRVGGGGGFPWEPDKDEKRTRFGVFSPFKI